MIIKILSILSFIVILYTICCFINILLTWIPGAKFTQFGRVISKICDPYMNFFSRKGWFRIRNLDFSPILSIGLLSLVSSILGAITKTGRISLAVTLGMIIQLIWQMMSSIISLFFIVVFIRWIVILVKKGQTDYNSIWTQVDSLLGNFCRRIAATFIKKPIRYETSLLVTWIVAAVILLFGNIVIRFLLTLCSQIPF